MSLILSSTTTFSPTDGCDSVTIVREPTFTKLNDPKSLDWWIEIFTAHPACVYYFGSFENAEMARAELPGFVDDLLVEGAKGLAIRIQSYCPNLLTIEGVDISAISHFPIGVDIV